MRRLPSFCGLIRMAFGRLRCYFLIFLAFFSVGISPTLAAADQELLGIVETSCTKSCVGGRGEEAFCTSYCQCVKGEVEKKAESTDIASVLKTKASQDEVIQLCSGQTAMSFFEKSCRTKCEGVPRCDAYCGCLSGKIKDGQTIEQVGSFFIELGKSEAGTVQKLKGFEGACSR